MATVRMPSSWAERKTRMAISLRLATSSFRNWRTGTGSGIGASAGGGRVSYRRPGPWPARGASRPRGRKRSGPAKGPARFALIRRRLLLALGPAADGDGHLPLGPVVGDDGDRLGQVAGLARLE